MLKPLIIFFLLLSTVTSLLLARGTAAGISIENQANIIYNVGGVEQNLTTNIDDFVVDQIVDIGIFWQDARPVEVGTNEFNRVLTFVLTNLGNGDDSIILNYEHNNSSDFSPQNVHLFLDSNGDGIYTPGKDTVVDDVNLSADHNITLFIVADIPKNIDTTSSASAHEILTARSQYSTTTERDNPDAIDIVVRTGSDSAEGIYQIRDYWLDVEKQAIVHSDDNETHTGTLITYSIKLSIGGNAVDKQIDSIVFKDQVPVGTRYVAGTLHLDDNAITDAVDVDSGMFVGDRVEVQIGALHSTDYHVVTFDVQVQ